MRVGVGFDGVGRAAVEVEGLGAERECALEEDRRGSTAASPSWCTSAEISMMAGDWKVVRASIHDRVLTQSASTRLAAWQRPAKAPFVCSFVSQRYPYKPHRTQHFHAVMGTTCVGCIAELLHLLVLNPTSYDMRQTVIAHH